MITICPKCALTLTVSAADLRIAQGQVRCGRCLAVFNALLALYDDLPARKPNSATHATESAATSAAIAPEPVAALAPAPTPEVAAESAATVVADEDADAVTGAHPVIEIEAPVETMQTVESTPDDSGDPTPTDVQAALDSAVVADADQPDEANAADASAENLPPSANDVTPANTFVLPPVANDALVDELPAANDPFITEAPPSANDPLIEDLAISEPRVLIPDRAEDAATIDVGDPQGEIEPLFMRGDVAAEDSAAAEAHTEPDETSTATEVAPAAQRRHGGRWALASLPLLLLLGAQLVHANREDLATRDGIGAPLRKLYEKLGAPIAARWDVNAYDVRQQGAVGAADAAAPLTVRASILNRGLRAQPLPLLRVTLQDRFGNRVALRDLQPREYLPAARAAQWLAAGQRIDAEVALADPGGKAVGFEIDACLQLVPGRYACANEHSAGTR